MNLLEELNKLLLEDKNRQFIASIEAFTAYDHPKVYYTYSPLLRRRGEGSAYMAAQERIGKSAQKTENMLKEVFRAKQYTRVEIIATGKSLPSGMRKQWETEVADRQIEYAEALEENGLRGKKLELEVKRSNRQILTSGNNTPITEDEFMRIASVRGNTAYFVGDVGRAHEPLIRRSTLDPKRIAAKYIHRYVLHWARDVYEDPSLEINTAYQFHEHLNDLYEDEDEDEGGHQKLFNQVELHMREDHVEYDGDFADFMRDVVDNIEEYALIKGQVSLSSLHSAAKKMGGGEKASAAEIAAIEPTADGRIRRNLTDLPRHDSDFRPTMVDSVNDEIENRRERAENPLYRSEYKTHHSWIVMTGYERSGYKGIKGIGPRDQYGRSVGKCPYCNGRGYVSGGEEDPEALWVPCQECKLKPGPGPGTGKDVAWYWASESNYEAHPEFSGEIEELSPFEKVFRTVWALLQNLNREPEAYDGFVREEHKESDGQRFYGAGKLRTQNGYPMPQIYPSSAEDLGKGASNSPLFTIVIKCLVSMGDKKIDLWKPDYEKGGEIGVFQEFTEFLGDELEEIGLGYSVEPLNYKFEPDDVDSGKNQSEPMGTAYSVNVWDYVVEPGYLYHASADQSLENEYLDPNQAPFEQLTETFKVWEIAKYLDSIDESQPHLWLALGLGNKYEIKQPGETFVSHIKVALENLKKAKHIRIAMELEKVLDQYKKYDYDAYLPSHLEQLFRVKTSMDIMFYAHVLGVPPRWNEYSSCSICGALSLNPECAKCNAGAKTVARERGKSLRGIKSIDHRWEGLVGKNGRADRIEKIVDKLSGQNQFKYENIQPHSAIRMGFGLYWDVSKEYQQFLEQKIAKQYEEYKAQEDPIPKELRNKLYLKGSGQAEDDRYLPIKYLQIAVKDLAEIVRHVESPENKDSLTDGELDELRTYYHEIVAIIERAERRLMDPALKKRMKRSRDALEHWEKYGKEEWFIQERSADIRRKLVRTEVNINSGRWDDEKCFSDKDCLESLIFMKVQDMVLGIGEVNKVESKNLWLRQNRYKSWLIIKDEIEQYLKQKGILDHGYNFDKLVAPGAELPIEVLKQSYMALCDLNGEGPTPPLDAHRDRLALVSRAFKNAK